MDPVIVSISDGPVTEIPGRGSSIGLVHPKLGARQMAMHVNVLNPGSVGPLHYHEKAENAYLILSGVASITIEDEQHEVPADHAVFIPPGVKHGVTNPGPEELRLLEIYAPPAFDDFHEVD